MFFSNIEKLFNNENFSRKIRNFPTKLFKPFHEVRDEIHQYYGNVHVFKHQRLLSFQKKEKKQEKPSFPSWKQKMFTGDEEVRR